MSLSWHVPAQEAQLQGMAAVPAASQWWRDERRMKPTPGRSYQKCTCGTAEGQVLAELGTTLTHGAAEELLKSKLSAMKCIHCSNNLVVWSQSVLGESFALPSFHPSSPEWGRKELPLLQPQDFWATLRKKNVTECSLLLLLMFWVIQYFFYLFYCELLVPTCSYHDLDGIFCIRDHLL